MKRRICSRPTRPIFRQRPMVTALCIAASLTVSTPIMAQQAQGTSANETASAAIHEFNIPAQPLSEALIEFGQQSGLQVSASSSLVESKQASVVKGAMTAQQALSQLLAGTGLTFRSNGAMISLETASGATTLPPVKVSADTARSDGLPEPYAGGQIASGGSVGILGNRDVMDTPFNQTSYTADLLTNQQARSMSEVLYNDPSTRVTVPASTGLDFFSIRGLAVSNQNVVFNGLPGIAPNFGDSMRAESLERVEIHKGPSSLLNGIGVRGDVGGIINIIPKRAKAEPLATLTPSFASDSRYGGHVDIGRRFGSDKAFGVRFNGLYEDGDLAIDNASRKSKVATLGLDYRGDRFRLSGDLGYQYQKFEGTRGTVRLAPGVAIPDEPDNTVNYNQPYNYYQPEVFYGMFAGELDVTEKVTAYAKIGGNVTEWDWIANYPQVVNEDGDLASGNATMRGNKIYTRSLEAGFRSQFETGIVNHNLTVAYSRMSRDWYSDRPSFAFPASNLYEPTYGLAPPASLVPDPDGDLPKIQDALHTSTVVANTASMFDERIQLMLGFRDQDVKSNTYDESATTPFVGLILKPWQHVSIYGNYIEGLQQGRTAPVGTVNEGEVFPPFATEQYEFGTKVDWGRIMGTLALFEITQPSAFTNISNVYVKGGEQRNRGIEVNVFGELKDGLRILGGATYIDAKLVETPGNVNEGNEANAVASVQAVLGVEYDTSFLTGLTLTGRVVHTGSAYLDPENTLEVDDWQRLDLGARYIFDRDNGKPVTIRINIENALDDNYWDTSTSGSLILSDPRTLKLSATFNL